MVAVQFTKFADVLYPPNVPLDRPYAEIVKWEQEQDPAAQVTSSRFRSDALGIAGDPANNRDEKGLESLLVYPPGYYGKG